MNPLDKRISRLEAALAREKNRRAGASNCYKLGYTMFRLAQLYTLTGSADKAKQILNEAQSIVQSPECVKNRKVERLSSAISYYLANPRAPPMIEVPFLVKYMSLIILLIGYVAAYIAYFTKAISSEFFFVTIIAVFVLSIVISSLSSITYLKRMNKNVMASRKQDLQSGYVTNPSETPDDIIDDAKAELSLANMFYSVKDMKETELHIERAKMYLSDPRTTHSAKREELLGMLGRLENAVREKKFLQG